MRSFRFEVSSQPLTECLRRLLVDLWSISLYLVVSELNGSVKRVLVVLLVVLNGYLPAQNASLYLSSMADTSLPFVRGLEWTQEVRAFGEEMPHELSVRFFFGDTTHALVHCLSDWYTLENGEWVNHYKLFSHGFTCGARLFFKGGYPVLYGGYGIWRGQSLNVHFVESGEWEMTKSPSMPEYLKAGPAFHYYDTSVVVIPGFVIDVDRIGAKEDVGYVIQPNGTWLPVEVEVEGKSRLTIRGLYEQELITDKYRVYISKGGKGELVYIQEKESGNIYETTFEYSSPSESSYLEGDTLYLLGERHTAYYIPNLINRGGLLTVVPVSANLFSGTLPILVSVVLLLVFILIRFNRKSPAVAAREELPDFYEALLELDRKGLTNEELNELLMLNDLTYDMMRKRRSLILKEVNAYHEGQKGSPLVVRQPNPEDKRQFIYHIEK